MNDSNYEDQELAGVTTESPSPALDRDCALATFEIATQCGDHRDGTFSEKDLGEVVYYGDNGADEFESVAVFKAADGNGFIVALESSDYTGHGCQCSGSATRYDSLDNALRLGLSDSDAEMCGAQEERSQALARFDKGNEPERDAEADHDQVEGSVPHQTESNYTNLEISEGSVYCGKCGAEFNPEKLK